MKIRKTRAAILAFLSGFIISGVAQAGGRVGAGRRMDLPQNAGAAKVSATR